MLVPIHAYPVVDTSQFPRSVKFPPTAIGQSRRKTVSLECDVPTDFEFQLSCLQHHPAFTVTPMKGISVSTSGCYCDGAVTHVFNWQNPKYTITVFKSCHNIVHSEITYLVYVMALTGSCNGIVSAPVFSPENVGCIMRFIPLRNLLKSSSSC